MHRSRRFLVASFLGALVLAGCQKTPAPVASPTGRMSRAGWEIRYNAVAALARRGSDRVQEHLETLAEMLDEDQQLVNFRTKLEDGRDVADEQAARGTVVSALKAVVELHAKKPGLDLSALDAAIAKLTQSANPIVRNEAERTRIALGSKRGQAPLPVRPGGCYAQRCLTPF